MASALSALFILPAVAQNQSRRLGDFGQWTAAVQRERGKKLCYAFTNVARMSHPRSDVFLMVTRGGSRGGEEVALGAGYRYPRQARVSVTVGRQAFPMNAEGNAAFARNSRAAIDAFRQGSEAVAHGPRRAGRAGTVTDAFSLRGFTAAYNAIRRECPPPRTGRRR